MKMRAVIRIMLLGMSSALMAGCASTPVASDTTSTTVFQQPVENKLDVQVYPNSGEIICDLMRKSASTSYAYDMVNGAGQTVKRVYIARPPQKGVRTEWTRGGQPYVFLGTLEGTYEYYPLRKIAYFTPSTKRDETTSKVFNCNPDEWTAHGAAIVGEEVIDGRECYLLKTSSSNQGEIVNSLGCLDKQTGQKLTLEQIENGNRRVLWYYRNYDFDLDDSLFHIPEGVQIITR